LLLTLPFCRYLEGPAARLLPEESATEDEVPHEHISVLDEGALKVASLALANLKREVMRMEQVLESMTSPIMEIFRSYDKDRALAQSDRDEVLNAALDGIRRYVAAMPTDKMSKQEFKQARELTEYAIALRASGDLVARTLMPLAREKTRERIKFSKIGRQELVDMHERLMANTGLASNVLLSDDLECARLLLEEKNEMTRLERSSRKKHLRRLSDGSKDSFASSDVHLEMLRVLREINSHVASVCYPILYRGGQLLETRLIETMDKDHDAAAE
jgi:phosphate:Na+ symporter